jgi:HEAT repeat protein
VFDHAKQWCSSQNPLERARGADVLAQLGKTADHPSHNYPDESFEVVSSLVREEKDLRPLLSAIHALGHISNPLAVPLVIAHRLDPNPEVRFAVAFVLREVCRCPNSN